MREIKFRAWYDGSMKCVEKINFRTDTIFCSWRIDNGEVKDEFNPKSQRRYGQEWDLNQDCVLMQFTGLKDKNGKEIYEGDIVKRKDYVNNSVVADIRTMAFPEL